MTRGWRHTGNLVGARRSSWERTLRHREASFRRVLGVLFEDIRLVTPELEGLSVDLLMATTADKRTIHEDSAEPTV
jgi:hypothetical protein